MPAELVNRVEKWADLQGIKRSEALRRLLQKALDDIDETDAKR